MVVNVNKSTNRLQLSSSQVLGEGRGSFDAAKLLSRCNLARPTGGEKEACNPLPQGSLTRLLTGDVPAEWLKGLGRMQEKEGVLLPAEGYKDTFVSSMGELKKRGISFDPARSNDPISMASQLDLKEEDVEKVRQDGAWLLVIHPGSKLAIPTKRHSQWNPEYREGGYTKSNQQEWVTPNVALEPEARAGSIRVYKMAPNGETIEWKFFKGKLMSIPEWRRAIDSHVRKVAATIG